MKCTHEINLFFFYFFVCVFVCVRGYMTKLSIFSHFQKDSVDKKQKKIFISKHLIDSSIVGVLTEVDIHVSHYYHYI